MTTTQEQTTELVIIDPVESAGWTNFVRTQDTNLFQSPDWMCAMNRTYGMRFKAAVLIEGGSIVAGVPFWESDQSVAQELVSLPFSDYCGVVAVDHRRAAALIDGMARGRSGWTLRTEVNALPDQLPDHRVQSRYKLHQINCELEPERIRAGFSRSARRSVMRSKRDGVTTKIADSEKELREWYLLHLRLRKQKYGLIAQPYSFFESLWSTFVAPGHGFLMLAYYDGQIIGGEFDIVWKDVVYSKFAATSMDHLHLRSSHLLIWESLLEARRRGCRLYDMGRTPVSHEGLIEFKRSLGVMENEIHYIDFGPRKRADTSPGGLHEVAVVLSRMLADKAIPDRMTERGSELLYRYFA